MYDSRYDGGRDAYGRDSYGRDAYGRDRDMFGRDERRRYRYEEERERDYSPERFHERERDYQPAPSAAGFGAKSEEYLLDIREFAAQHRDRQRSRKGSSQEQPIDDEEISKRYEVYKKSFVNTMNEKYFKIHSSQEWFREKYHPKENTEFLKQVLSRKAEALQEFEADVVNGKWDAVNLNEVDPSQANPGGLNHGIDLKSNATCKSNVLFITGVPLEVKRADLLQLCNQIPGFKYLELSEPRPDKNNVRIGWITCHEGTDMNIALQSIREKKVDSHVLNVLGSGKGIPTSLRSVTGHANKPSRLVHDLAQAKRLAEHLDEKAEFEADHGISFVLKYFEPLLEQILPAERKESNQDVDMSEQNDEQNSEKNNASQIDSSDEGINAARVSKELDIIIVYLHKVHFFDYYNQFESTNPEDHTRRGSIATRKSYEKVKDPQFPPYWLKKLSIDERINPTPPQDPQVRLEKEMTKYIVKEADSKFRCSECQKLFRGDEFVRKHLRSKHPVLVEHLDVEVKFFNNFCAKAHPDLYKAPSHRDANHHYKDETSRGGGGYQGGKRSYPDRDRDVSGRGRPRPQSQPSRGGRRLYTDLDAQKHQNIILNYD